MKELIELFIKHKRYLQGVSENTVYHYSLCFKAWADIHGDTMPDKQNINEWLIKLREGGIPAPGCDACARGFNAFLTWLYEEGHTPELLKVKRAKLEKKVIKTFSEAEARAVISYRSKDKIELRTHTMILVALDTGRGLMSY